VAEADYSQVTMEQCGIYLSFITLLHTPSFVRTHHIELAARALLKRNMFRMPQPPSCFGFAKRSQLHRWKCFLPATPDHKKLNIKLQILCKIEVGIAASAIQYMAWPLSTDFTRVNRPPRDNHLLHHHPIFSSNFDRSQHQSSGL
jgi:hypothetical protein